MIKYELYKNKSSINYKTVKSTILIDKMMINVSLN